MQEQKYLNLLRHLGTSNYRNRTQGLSCFSAQRGHQYNHNLMVVGRAVNGWYNEFDLNSLSAESMVKEIFDTSEHSVCPLEWVEESWGDTEGYNTKSSAFWRVVKQVTNYLNKTNSLSSGWSSQIVWSNLYKVAPSTRGNPSDSLCDKQFSACNELLLAEIKEYKPRVIIFLTGLNWFNGFLSDHVSLTKNDGHNLVESCGTLLVDGETIKVVVAKHPQGKSESTMVSEIIDVINQ